MELKPSAQNTLKTNRQEDLRDRKFGIDWQGHNTDDPKTREERVDVSPAGTEGIFIDPEAYIYD
ncbi:MAG TPA: hypothetical protein VEF33_00100 [Syntrophales bacterium]|nr:hypothetical protein [Syntrophales bacterium]